MRCLFYVFKPASECHRPRVTQNDSMSNPCQKASMVVGAEVCVELRAHVGHDAPAERSLLKCVFLSAVKIAFIIARKEIM